MKIHFDTFKSDNFVKQKKNHDDIMEHLEKKKQLVQKCNLYKTKNKTVCLSMGKPINEMF